jgi:hypothetical protein
LFDFGLPERFGPFELPFELLVERALWSSDLGAGRESERC